MKKRAACALLACSAFVPAIGKPVFSCALGRDGRSQVVALSSRRPIADTAIYELRQGNGARRPLFGLGEPDGSRGLDVRVQCAGTHRRAMVVMGEFMSAGYPRGLVITYEPRSRRFERADFAERNAPAWLYVGRKDKLLVFPPGGRAQTQDRYLVHRFVEGAAQGTGEEAVDALPDTRGYERIRIRLGPLEETGH